LRFLWVETELFPGRATRCFYQLDENAMARTGMNERDGTLGAPPRHPVDELQSIGRQSIQFGGNVVHLETDMVEALPARLQEARDARARVRGLDELDIRLADWKKGDPNSVIRDGQQDVQREAQLVTIDVERGIKVTHDDRNVMDLAGPFDQFERMFHIRYSRLKQACPQDT
jgi:hypothetical protein